MNDTRLLLEEQTSRNQLLEKKQRKFDSELAMVIKSLRKSYDDYDNIDAYNNNDNNNNNKQS